jgi:hypothetical protein
MGIEECILATGANNHGQLAAFAVDTTSKSRWMKLKREAIEEIEGDYMLHVALGGYSTVLTTNTHKVYTLGGQRSSLYHMSSLNDKMIIKAVYNSLFIALSSM